MNQAPSTHLSRRAGRERGVPARDPPLFSFVLTKDCARRRVSEPTAAKQRLLGRRQTAAAGQKKTAGGKTPRPGRFAEVRGSGESVRLASEAPSSLRLTLAIERPWCRIDRAVDERGACRICPCFSFPVSRCGAPSISVTSVPLVPPSARYALAGRFFMLCPCLASRLPPGGKAFCDPAPRKAHHDRPGSAQRLRSRWQLCCLTDAAYPLRIKRKARKEKQGQIRFCTPSVSRSRYAGTGLFKRRGPAQGRRGLR